MCRVLLRGSRTVTEIPSVAVRKSAVVSKIYGRTVDVENEIGIRRGTDGHKVIFRLRIAAEIVGRGQTRIVNTRLTVRHRRIDLRRSRG